MRAWITREPWLDRYEVRLAYNTGEGRPSAAATGVDERGNIIWTQLENSLSIVPPFLVLPVDVMEALARAAGDITQASDQTVDSLKDSRVVRDRLLTLVETVINERTP